MEAIDWPYLLCLSGLVEVEIWAGELKGILFFRKMKSEMGHNNILGRSSTHD
jgi:hypothetical protein